MIRLFKHISRLAQSRHAMAVGDQILLSLANFLTAFVLVGVAGVEWFGIYSFILVFCLLAHQGLMSLLHGQMTLHVSGRSRALQNATLRSTLLANLVLFLALVLTISLVFVITPAKNFFSRYPDEILTAVVFTFLLSSFELFRRFLYVLSRQDLSVVCTALYMATLSVGLAVVYWAAPAEQAVTWVFCAHCLALAVGLASNGTTLISLRTGRKLNPGLTVMLFQRFFRQGRFGFLGMLVTWAQNQSMTPILMWIGGPTIVGQFNIARLLTTPIVVINAGITSSAVPKLRELYRQKGKLLVKQRTSQLAAGNLAVCIVYLVLLLVLDRSGFLARFIPDYSHVQKFLVLWSLVSLAIMYRTWMTQYFAVAMEFRFLLVAGIAATLLTFLLMFAVHLAGGNHYYLPVCILAGEIFLYSTLKLRQIRDPGRTLPES